MNILTKAQILKLYKEKFPQLNECDDIQMLTTATNLGNFATSIQSVSRNLNIPVYPNIEITTIRRVTDGIGYKITDSSNIETDVNAVNTLRKMINHEKEEIKVTSDIVKGIDVWEYDIHKISVID